MDTSACIINEITKGIELANQQSILCSESSLGTKQILTQGTMSLYDRALVMVNGDQSGDQTPPLTPPPIPSQPESSDSIDASPRSGDLFKPFDDQQDHRTVSKKRKAITMRNQIKISTDNGLEGNTDDGYSWRKYGQYDIFGTNFSRGYYNCTYRHIHHCMARKQVQRSYADPTMLEITYRGQHTCNPTITPSAAPLQSPEKHKD